MGFGSFIKKAVGRTPLAKIAGGDLDPFSIFSGRSQGSTSAPAGSTPEQITAANVFGRLSAEQQKDLLINNPNIITSQGSQRFDPLTNTLTLEESGFQEEQRLRQEALLEQLTGDLSGGIGSLDPEAVTQAAFQSGKELLDPGFKTDRERLSQQLADQGLPIGSEAHTEALNRIDASQGTQLRQLAFGSVREGIQTSEFQRQQRFNEISSLLGQGGVGFNQFQPQRSGLDLLGAEQASLNRQFQGQQASKDRSSAQRSALVGAFGRIGSAAVGAFG